MTNIRKKPFLRWAGSKQKLIPSLSKYWDGSCTRYVEPFAGSACFFFYLAPKKAILADINKELIDSYVQIRDNLNSVISEISKLKGGKENYYNIRDIDPKTLSPKKRAARFIYLNRNCFNGLYRTNLAGKFNVPYGASKKNGQIPSKELLKQCSGSLQNTTLIGGSFEKTLKKVKKGDFVYMDPPYSVNNKKIFTEYHPASFSSNKIHLLHKWMVQLNKLGIKFLVSYAESQEAELLQIGFHTEKVKVRRSIAGFSSNRKIANEVLISNYQPAN